MVENFPNMGKEIVNQVQEAQRIPYRMNPKKNTPRHTVLKMTVTVILPKVLGHTTARLNLLK